MGAGLMPVRRLPHSGMCKKGIASTGLPLTAAAPLQMRTRSAMRA